MKLIVCADSDGGVSFFGKRVSKDRVVGEDIKKMIKGSHLYAHPYSRSFFLDPPVNVYFDENYKDIASDNDFVFYEIGQIDQTDYETLILYCWNKEYPKEAVFIPDDGFTLIQEEDFSGYSHDRITKKIFTR